MGHENEFNGLYGDILGWVSGTFGSERDPKGIIMKMDEEIDELWRAIERWQKGWRDKEEMYAEVADLMILVVNLAFSVDPTFINELMTNMYRSASTCEKLKLGTIS